MIKNKIYQIPIVDSSNKIIGLSLWDDFNKPLEYENKMILMVGGRGTRLQPHTENCPKPMVKVGGSPILEHIILKAKKNGFSNFYLAINHLGHVIEDYFGDGKKFNVNIQYIDERETYGGYMFKGIDSNNSDWGEMGLQRTMEDEKEQLRKRYHQLELIK